MDISSTMTRTIVYLTPHDRLPLAHTIMLLHGFRHIPIVQERRVCGMLSDRDVLRWSRMEQHSLIVPDIPIEHIMQTQLITCLPDASVAKVAGLMAGLQIDAIPIVDAQHYLVGLVTSTDLLELLANQDGGAGSRLLPYDFSLHSANSLPAVQ